MKNRTMKPTYAIMTVLLAALVSSAAAQPAYRSGEVLTYKVSYRAKMIPNTEVARVRVTVADTAVEGRAAYRITGNARTLPSFRWFYNLDDTYNSYVDAESGRPFFSNSAIRENSFRSSSRFDYDWDAGVAATVKRRKQNPPVERRITLSDKSYDGVSLFYDLRSLDSDGFVRGEERTIALLLDDTVRHIRYKFLGRERKKVRGVGTFRTLKFSCQLATSTGDSFDDGTECLLWISDDRNKIPVFFESPIKVGSVRAYIESYEGLRYPVESLSD